MTSPRKEFLAAMFRTLEQKAIRYCVLRNYQNIYEDASSDVDLLVAPADLRRTEDCLAVVAATSNHRFVQRGRFALHSCIFWHPEGGLLRIDIQREVRWQIFPVLTAQAILELRRKEGLFWIPDPGHESAILLNAAISRGYLSERYRKRLAWSDRPSDPRTAAQGRAFLDPRPWSRVGHSVKCGHLAGISQRALPQATRHLVPASVRSGTA